MTGEELAARVALVDDRIDAAARRVGRAAGDVTLVAVSKTFSAAVVAAALDAGVTDLGENRAQELREKAAVLGGRPRWHFIGNLQTNKVRHVVGVAVLVHSVDRIGLAEALDARASALGLSQDVLIEVNVSGETTKHGVEPARVLGLADQIAALGSLRLRGLMTMAPFADDPEMSRPHFTRLRSISEDLRVLHPEAIDLSMGMTRDFEVAVEEGATIVRVGEAIFGPRG
jgi:pyridoxal phosphate enzyme (YggS family)